ncbi:KRAB [Mytilus coruscus]|uniref:KRAB n=1 Tax=Mytilus coruscus TaxID=42192 RepID=A0A6J8EQM3_MYTCO|nr:KRAB [Mytilus coruscus]
MNTDGKISSSGESDIIETLSKINPVHKSFKKGNFNQTDLIIGYGVIDKVREVQREIVERSARSGRMDRNSLLEPPIGETTDKTNESINSEAQEVPVNIPRKRGRPRKKRKKRKVHSTKSPTKDDSTLSSDSLKIHLTKDSRKGYCSKKQWKSSLPTLSDSSDLPEEMVSPNEDVWFGNSPATYPSVTSHQINSEFGQESECSKASSKGKTEHSEKKTSFNGIEYQAKSVRKSMIGKVMRKGNLKNDPCVSSSEESCEDFGSFLKTNPGSGPCHTISKAPQDSFTSSDSDLNQINEFGETGTETAEMSNISTQAENISKSNEQESTMAKKITSETIHSKHEKIVDFDQKSGKNEVLEKLKTGKGRQKKSGAISKQRKDHGNIFENFDSVATAKSPESVKDHNKSNLKDEHVKSVEESSNLNDEYVKTVEESSNLNDEYVKTVEESMASHDEDNKAITGKGLEFKKSPNNESNTNDGLVSNGYRTLIGSNIQCKHSPVSSNETEEIIESLTEIQMPLEIESDIEPYSFPISIDCCVSLATNQTTSDNYVQPISIVDNAATKDLPYPNVCATSHKTMHEDSCKLVNSLSQSHTIAGDVVVVESENDVGTPHDQSNIESENDVTFPHDQSNVGSGNYGHKGNLSPNGTYIRKDKHMENKRTDFAFKRPAPISGKKSNPCSDENDSHEGKIICSVPPIGKQPSCSILETVFGSDAVSPPKRRNVVFVNLTSKKARELERKRKEEEKLQQNQPKKQNVPFFFPSKKRKMTPQINKTQNEKVCRQVGGPTPSKTIKLERLDFMKNTEIGGGISTRETTHSIGAKHFISSSQENSYAKGSNNEGVFSEVTNKEHVYNCGAQNIGNKSQQQKTRGKHAGNVSQPPNHRKMGFSRGKMIGSDGQPLNRENIDNFGAKNIAIHREQLPQENFNNFGVKNIGNDNQPVNHNYGGKNIYSSSQYNKGKSISQSSDRGNSNIFGTCKDIENLLPTIGNLHSNDISVMSSVKPEQESSSNNLFDFTDIFDVNIITQDNFYQESTGLVIDNKSKASSGIDLASVTATSENIPQNMTGVNNVPSMHSVQTQGNIVYKDMSKLYSAANIHTSIPVAQIGGIMPESHDPSKLCSVQSGTDVMPNLVNQTHIPESHNISTKLNAVKSFASENSDDHVIDFLDLDRSHADRFLEEIETNPQPSHETDHEKLQRRGKLRSLYMSHNATTSGPSHEKLASNLDLSQEAYISTKTIGNQRNMNNSGKGIKNAERESDIISKPTNILDNLILNENKKLVVSLQKLTHSDIQRQTHVTGLETMETETDSYIEEFEEDDDLPSLKPWHCALCNEQYHLKKELIRHISMVHEISQFDSRLRNYICNMEGKSMSKNSHILSDDILKTGQNTAVSVTYADVSNKKGHGQTVPYSQTALGHRDKIITIVDQEEDSVNKSVGTIEKQQSKIVTNVSIDPRWKCLICPMRFLTKIDVIQHVRMKHKQATSESTPYEFEPASRPTDQSDQSAKGTSEKSSLGNNSSFTAPRKVIRRKKEEKKKAKVKETSEILIISSKTNSIPFDIFRAPMDEPEELRQILSVKWYCKLCPNWYRLRKCCLQHVQKEHDIRGNWARFYFHNSQQVTCIPSMEICTGPHVDVKAYQFCIVCGRSYVDVNETTRHVRRNHGYIAEVHRTMCVQDKMDTIKIIVACDIFMDLHMYVVGSKSALLVQKDFFDELFQNCMSNNIRDFRDSDVAVARQLKRILFENGMINLEPSEQEILGDVAHNYDVYKISFQEDFQWDRRSQKHGSTGGKMSQDDSDSSEDRDPNTSSDNGRNVSEETRTSDNSGRSDVVSLHRCHKCNLSFEDRMTLDKHNLTHKIQVRFSCRLCSKNFPKLFFLLQHLEVKHNQTQATYFQFVLEHEQVIEEEAETEEQIMDQAGDESDSSNSAIINVQSGEDDEDQELDSDDVETTETRTCFVCGKNFETRLSLFTHLKDKHKIYKRKCLNCNKNFSCKTDLQKHFADIHDIDFVVDLSEQIFRCFVCDVIMESRSELKEHLPTHEKEGYNCNLCEMKYTAPSSLRFHKRTVHWKLEGTRSCKICDDKLFTNMKAYESHMLNHFYDFLGPMKCAKCNITCKNKKSYKQHIASHGLSLVCEHCGKVCLNQHALRHHVVTHNLSKKCEICGKMLNKYSLKNHMTKVHGEKEKAACPHCGRLVNQSYMNAHIEEMHNKVKTFDERKKKVCDVCGKVFKRPGLLKTHMVVHTGERPYVCEVCDRSFGYKTALNTHYATHKGFKPHKCKFCTSSFWLISQCKAHMKSDHGYIDPDLKHACHCCDKRFKHLAGLRLHMDETHPEMVPGPKFYPCHKCKKEFKYRKSLREHIAVCSPGTELGNLYRKRNDTSNSSGFVDSQEPHVVEMDVFETFQDVGHNELQIHEQIISDQPHLASGMIQKQLTAADGQQIIIQEQQSGDVSYQTIYIQSEDPASHGQVYVQDVSSQDQIILQEGNNEGEIIVALPDNCGEYNVDFLTSSNAIVQEGDIGYAEIIVQDQ